jgi:hypothetical protein
VPGKPGPKPDNEGHKRIAELLANKPDWCRDLNATCELLTNPADGRQGPKVSPYWRKKYNVSTYAEAFQTIAWNEVYRNIERRIYQGKCLNGTIHHRATRPKRTEPQSYTLRELKRLMNTWPHTPDRTAWREMIRAGLFEDRIFLLEIDLVESVAKETLQRSNSPSYVSAWNITPELVEACEGIVAITSQIPWKVRHPERRSILQKILDFG